MKKYIFAVGILIFLCSSLLAADESDRIECVCTAGFANTVKLNYWHHLTVNMTSYYPAKVEVLVKVSRKHEYEPELKLEQLITIAPPKTGENLKYKLIFVCPPFRDSADSEYIIEVLDNSNNSTLLKESYWTTITRNDKEYPVKKWRKKPFIIVRPNTLEHYEEQVLICNSGQKLPFFAKDFVTSNDSDESNILFTNTKIDEIPNNWLVLEAIKLIVLCNPDTNKLKLFNREKAIENWVRSGGSIVLMLSEKYLEYKNNKLVRLADLNLKGSKTVHEIIGKMSNSINNSMLLPGKLNGINAEIKEKTNKTFEIFIDAKQKNPVVTKTWLDAGIITCILFDFRGKEDKIFDKKFKNFIAEKLILPLKNDFTENDLDDLTAYDEWGNSYYEQRVNNINIHKNLGDIINNIQKAKPVSFEIIAIFVCFYMFIIAFFDYILLKIFSILHWTWLSVLIWVIAFVIAADYIGESFRGGEMNVREIAVIDSGGLGESAKISQYAGVFSQQNLSYTVFHDNDQSGITRLDRIYIQEHDYNRYYYDDSEDVSYMKRALEVDKNSTYSVFQLADTSKKLHNGAYLKSVVLPRWAIRDLQAKSIYKYSDIKTVKDPTSPNSTKSKNANTVVRRGFQISVSENNGTRSLSLYDNSNVKSYYVPDKILTVKNTNSFSISGFVIIYGDKKTFLSTETLDPGEAKELFFFEDFTLLVDPDINHIDGFESSDMSLNSILDNYDTSYNFNWFDTEDKLELVLGNQYFEASSEFCSLFFSSFSNYYSNSVKSQNNNLLLMFKNHSYSSLDISHRLEMGDTIILSWTNPLTKSQPQTQNNIRIEYSRKSNTNSEVKNVSDNNKNKNFENQTTQPELPSIQFENWEPSIERFVFLRDFYPPIQLLLRIS